MKQLITLLLIGMASTTAAKALSPQPIIYRPTTGEWFVGQNPPIQWGLPGDIPLATSFNNDGQTDIVVWRPSNGTFYIQYHVRCDGVWCTQPHMVVQWGLPGDVPLLTDIDHDGYVDLVVWRPSTGTWYYMLGPNFGSSNPGSTGSIQWGLPNDLPVVLTR